MSSAPLLKIIDGGRSAAEDAPSLSPALPPARESERLYPVLTSGGGAAFVHVVAVSLILHGAIVAASVTWNLFGEERSDGGSDEIIVIEGVNVVLLDQVPSVASPLAEAQEIEAADTAEPIAETEIASSVEPAAGGSPLPGEAIPLGSESVMEVPAEAAPEGGETAAAGSETISAAEPDWAEAPTVADVPPAAAPTMPIEADDPDAALATADEAVSEPEADEATVTTAVPTLVTRDQRSETTEPKRPPDTPPEDAAKIETAASEIVPEPETPPVEEKVEPVPPEESVAELVPEDTVKPVDEALEVAATEIVPEPPAEPKKPKPAKNSVASLANPSAPSSEANPTARGPSKSKAGAGGTNPKAQGKASLSSYQSRLVAHLRRYRTYPNAARSKRLQGTAVVSFTIDGGGRVVGASLAKGTGHSILDREALAMVRRASPFPAIPAGMSKSRVTVRAPIRFDMR